MTPTRDVQRREPARRGGPARTRAVNAQAVGAEAGLSTAVLFVISNLSYFAAAAIIAAHLLFAVEEHAFPVRVLTAIPGVILVLEGRKFLKDEAGDLPFVVLALVQYYAVFCLGIFFELKFFDVSGLVWFTQDARLSGAAAVALGAVCIWAGARVGRHVGKDARPWATKVLPPTRVPAEWDSALFLFTAACIGLTLVQLLFPGIVPPALELPVSYALPIELAIGFMIVVPPRRLGDRAGQIAFGFLLALGMLKGNLELIFRAGIAYIAGRWAVARTISIRIAVAVVTLYVLLQPVKGTYRAQVWAPAARTGQTVGIIDRVSAWGTAFGAYFSDREAPTESDTGAMARLSELGSVMHAFQVLPGRVEFLDGQGFVPILYAPIPRFIWPNKPTTRDTVQRYGIVFGRQTEEGARSTAVNLPLLVEGYWNFGWPGIALVTAALGFWVGLSQKVFTGDHWALRATGIANITGLTVAGPIVYVYGTVFQTLTGRTAVCWGIFWLATLLSKKRYDIGHARMRSGPAGLKSRIATHTPATK